MASPPALACSSFDKLVYITFQTYAYGTATGDSKILKLAPKIKIPSLSTLTIFPIISMHNICFFLIKISHGLAVCCGKLEVIINN